MKIVRVALIIFCDAHGRVLLQDRRGISKWGEAWSLFGGHIEGDETPEEALVREVREELGYNLTHYELIEHLEDVRTDVTYDRWVYAAPLPPEGSLRVLEGAGMKLFRISETKNINLLPGQVKALERLEPVLLQRFKRA